MSDKCDFKLVKQKLNSESSGVREQTLKIFRVNVRGMGRTPQNQLRKKKKTPPIHVRDKFQCQTHFPTRTDQYCHSSSSHTNKPHHAEQTSSTLLKHDLLHTKQDIARSGRKMACSRLVFLHGLYPNACVECVSHIGATNTRETHTRADQHSLPN